MSLCVLAGAKVTTFAISFFTSILNERFAF